MSTLKEVMQADVSKVFHDTNHFAETVTYCPSGGGSRSIVVTILRDELSQPDEAYHKKEVRLLEVFASLDTATGIPNPKSGDHLERPSYTITQPDGSVLKWDFQSVTNIDSGGVTLVFHSSRLLKSGQRLPASL